MLPWVDPKNKALRFESMNPDDPQVAKLIEESDHDKWLEGAAKEKLEPKWDRTHYTTFWLDGQPVGFSMPRQESNGRWRTGPIFVAPLYRGKGIAGSFIKAFFVGKKGLAYIEPMNVASISTFKAAGFVKTPKVLNALGFIFHQYHKD